MGSRQPEKAKQDINALQRKKIDATDRDWIKMRQSEAEKIANELKKEAADLEQKARKQPADKTAQLEAVKIQYKLGKTDLVAKGAENILKSDPNNRAAMQLAIDNYEWKGDTTNAIRLVKKAETNGVLIQSPRSRQIFTKSKQ